MKKTKQKFAVLLLFSILASLAITNLAQSTVPLAEDIKTGFIDKVLPFDRSKHTVTSTYSEGKNGASDIAHYTLESTESIIVVNCYIQNNVLYGCSLFTKEGQILSDREYYSLTDSVISFLEKYAEYTGKDSTKLINMVAAADISKDLTVISDNTKFTIKKQFSMNTELTTFCWADTFNGADYTYLQVGFRNGTFGGFVDTRVKYSIGDTTVKISKEQAINIAMKYVETSYSYAMPDGSIIRDFNVTENRTVAELHTIAINSTALKPYWYISFYLNQTYPGSVYGLLVRIWAGSGEVFRCTNEAGGGLVPIDSTIPTSEGYSVIPTPEESNLPSSNATYAIGIAVTIIAIVAIFMITLVKKKTR